MGSLFNYDKRFFSKCANEVGFIRDTLGKVYRLADILEYINNNHLLKEALTLKGGTAINLTVFNLPRLSVDIDLDYCNPVDRDEMLREREIIMLQKMVESIQQKKGIKLMIRNTVLTLLMPSSRAGS